MQTRYPLAVVYLALEPKAASEAIGVAADTGWSVWVGSDAVSPEEHKQLLLRGAKLTRFSYPLASATPDVIDGALATVEEHHPGEIIWIQHKTASESPCVASGHLIPGAE
jgi:hypothetical protein